MGRSYLFGSHGRIFSDPMVDVIAEIANRIGLSPFICVSFILAPLASTAGEVFVSMYYCMRQKGEKDNRGVVEHFLWNSTTPSGFPYSSFSLAFAAWRVSIRYVWSRHSTRLTLSETNGPTILCPTTRWMAQWLSLALENRNPMAILL